MSNFVDLISSSDPERPRHIIGLMGYARVGKDTVASELGMAVYHFADDLKADVAPLIQHLGLDPILDKEIIRPIYVAYGTAARATNPRYWVERLAGRIHDQELVIADVRYANEVDWILSQGGKVFYLTRQGVNPANDEEAASITQALTQFAGQIQTVPNDGYPNDAANRIRNYVAST